MGDTSQKSKIFYALSLGLELGFIIVLPLILFLFLGIFLDKRFNSFPIFLIIGIILGFVVTIFNIRKLVLPFLEKKVGKDNNQNKKLLN